jgi:hypothetical protein
MQPFYMYQSHVDGKTKLGKILTLDKEKDMYNYSMSS